MSGLLDVLNACRKVADGAVGVTTSYLNTPEKPPDDAQLPAVITRFDQDENGEITMAGLEQWIHPVEQILLVRRLGNRAGEDAEVMPYLDKLIGQFRAHIGLIGVSNCALMNDVRYRIGEFVFFNESFWGASLHIRIEELLEVHAQLAY